ncbi:metal-dependent hydrolase [Natronococcus wangiae]|uniref:metal-dependent hydrolase n=1 Tax=Natronococcus wangiae TaxID=3068275 RepID=UPI00273FFF0E|nr:metal-dependent hydrolase [Natronococcus sp. AD5]
MFVGHALLAFALVVLFTDWRNWPTRRAVTLGLVAGAFAALPDIDVAYALVAVDGERLLGSVDPTAFWDATRDVHRSMTHSLVVALATGPAFGFLTARGTGKHARSAQALAAVVLCAIVGGALVTSGPFGGIVMGVFALVGAGLATLIRRRTELSPRIVALAATVGLVTHPWGDLTTGRPPLLTYPFESGLVGERVVLHGDPTIHLLGAFALELAVVWLAVLAVARATDRSLWRLSDRSAAVGTVYGVLAIVMAPPTLSVSYHFVFSLLSVGALCGVLSWRRSPPSLAWTRFTFASLSWGRPEPVSSSRRYPDERTVQAGLAFVVTALTAITVALVGYAAVYVLLGA